MQPALSTRNRRLFNRRPSLLWKIRKVVQKYSIIIAFLPRHHKPQLLTPNRAAGCSQSKCPLGWDPAAAGSRAGDGMACNDSDRRQWRMQGAVVGAAASDL